MDLPLTSHAIPTPLLPPHSLHPYSPHSSYVTQATSLRLLRYEPTPYIPHSLHPLKPHTPYSSTPLTSHTPHTPYIPHSLHPLHPTLPTPLTSHTPYTPYIPHSRHPLHPTLLTPLTSHTPYSPYSPHSPHSLHPTSPHSSYVTQVTSLRSLRFQQLAISSRCLLRSCAAVLRVSSPVNTETPRGPLLPGPSFRVPATTGLTHRPRTTPHASNPLRSSSKTSRFAGALSPLTSKPFNL